VALIVAVILFLVALAVDWTSCRSRRRDLWRSRGTSSSSPASAARTRP